MKERGIFFDRDVEISTSTQDDPKRQTLKIIAIPCTYGGLRHFVICPCCFKRVRHLYRHQGLYGCRLCFGLSYWTQNQTTAMRLFVKQRNIYEGHEIDEWERPKGMHRTTFERLKREFVELDEMREVSIAFPNLRNRAALERFLNSQPAWVGFELWELENGRV